MSVLTRCEDCGEDMHVDSYICDKCGQELCYLCYQMHKEEIVFGSMEDK